MVRLATDTFAGIADRMADPAPKAAQIRVSAAEVCYRTIVTIVTEHPEKAFVKGGLFRKFGVGWPRPVLQLFMRRSEIGEERTPSGGQDT
jgi:hypothetical protein